MSRAQGAKEAVCGRALDVHLWRAEQSSLRNDRRTCQQRLRSVDVPMPRRGASAQGLDSFLRTRGLCVYAVPRPARGSSLVRAGALLPARRGLVLSGRRRRARGSGGACRAARLHSLLRSSPEGWPSCLPEAFAGGCSTPAGVFWRQDLQRGGAGAASFSLVRSCLRAFSPHTCPVGLRGCCGTWRSRFARLT